MLTMRKRFVIILGCVLLLFVASVILYPNTKNTLSLEEAKARLQEAYKMKIGMINIDGENEESFVKIAETSGEDVLELVDIFLRPKSLEVLRC